MQCPQLRVEDFTVVNEEDFEQENILPYSRNANIPERFLTVNFDNTQNRCSEVIKNFALSGNGVFVLGGGNGTGKTRTACCAINHRIINSLHSGLYISCSYEVCPAIRASRSFRAQKSEYEVLKEYYTTPFLVLDELGKGDDQVISKMFATCVLAARYDNNLPTLITTNLTKNEVADFLGKDIISRFSETAIFAVLDGNDWRKA